MGQCRLMRDSSVINVAVWAVWGSVGIEGQCGAAMTFMEVCA